MCYRGHTVFKGYYKDDEATNDCFDSDGWFHTGELLSMMPDGRLEFIGRLSFIIKIPCGLFVNPEEIEEVVNKFDTVD